ncbi:TPA: hypothetical protein ACNP4C_000028 [Klebsiella oxytoca]|uniref:hypothetical protein n=1 Tax=Klebsiella oxytoca TaxID=571 RepID=UPI0029952F3B|nr:hypothetical protein [Klebsiella oxytoca]
MTDITELPLLVSKAKVSVFTLEYISQFDPADIDSDDVDLRFEVDDMDTGTNVSIVDECGQAAKVIGALVEALEKAQTKAVEQGRTACELFDEVTTLRQRIAELEEAQSMHESDTLMLCRQFDELAAAMGWSSELAMQQGVSQLEYARSLKERIADLESRTVTVSKSDIFNVPGGETYVGGEMISVDTLRLYLAEHGIKVEAE